MKPMGELLRAVKALIEPKPPNVHFDNMRQALINILDPKAPKAPDGTDMDVIDNFVYDPHYASEALDALVPEAKKVLEPVLAKLHGLLNLHVAEAEPRSMEARRRLTFFVNSLFMDLPKAPSIAHMMSWTVLTPFYGEEVVFSRKDLEQANKDGINQLLYLKTLYPTDWGNFRERLGVKDDAELWTKPQLQQELRLWASLRAQTLSRTVQGMMYYEQALRVLGKLDREVVGQQGIEGLEEHIVRKFGYVVSCQIYGRQKQHQDPKADDIEMLLRRYPNLRVAYIDEVRGKKDGELTFFSVLVRGAANGKGVEEVFRVKLPGNPVLGEGKPENQNHAVIFTRGEHIMAIDMNQEGYFEDAFKMRNFLQEFAASDPDVPTTILGFREHIFTGGVSSLANYMALQEYSFVTLGQRVLNRPLRMRLHYGHPDLFDKLFFMQNGGVSKASKSINLSEDIFAGYNNVLRGGAVEFKEYVQVGKGRDVGMQQIYKFEAKLSEGAAEQSLSRDLSRMLARVDFFRLLSFYFGGIGHYLSSVLTVAAIWGLVYLMLGLALFNLERIGDRPIVPEGALQFALAGVGVLQTVPLFCTLLLEKGFVGACTEVLQVFISGGPLYFIFHIRTRDYYYTHTVLAGGSGYKATGRGFVISHSPFDENFRFFASSHLYLGFEVAAALILLAFYSDAGQYAGRTWSLWFAAVAFLFAPFWFNPMTFEWDRVMEDYGRWMAWMGNTGGAVANSWESWWKDECSFVKKLTASAKLYLVARSFVWLVIGAGLLWGPLCAGSDTTTERTVGLNVLLSFGKLLCLFALKLLVEWSYPRVRTWRDRHIFMTLFYFLAAICAIDIVIKAFAQDVSAFVFALAGYYLLSFVVTCLFVCDRPFFNTHVVKRAHWLHDQLLAHAIFFVLWVLAALQVVNRLQTFVLYRNSLSRGVVVAELIRNAQASQAQNGKGQGQAQQAGDAAAAAAAAAAAGNGGAGGVVSLLSSTARGGAASRISPEEKPAEQRVVELGGEAGSGGSNSSKKKGGRAAGAGTGTAGTAGTAAAAAAGGEAAPKPPTQQVVESFAFRQPTDFPKRS
jgi:callose synthase